MREILTPSLEGRYDRLCPQHHEPVEERGTQLVCPRGGHAVSAWKVVDREKATVLAIATPDPKGKEGIMETKTRLGKAPGSAGGKTETIESKHYADPEGNKLRVSLFRYSQKRNGDSFRVIWRRTAKNGQTQAGTTYASPYREKAHMEFEKAQKALLADGWEESAHIGRGLSLVPLPKAQGRKR